MVRVLFVSTEKRKKLPCISTARVNGKWLESLMEEAGQGIALHGLWVMEEAGVGGHIMDGAGRVGGTRWTTCAR
jgi:hypothetical protein